MKIETYSPVRTMSGTNKGSDLVYMKRNGRVFARYRPQVESQQTSEQLLIQAYFRNASQNWDTLTAAQRQAWQDYAELYFSTDEKGLSITPSGIATYLKANSIRQVLGLGLTSDAPAAAPPAPATAVAQVDGGLADTLGITVTHLHTTLTGLQVIVRSTAAMPTVACTPQPTDFRYVRGVSPLSSVALMATGGEYQFTPTRYSVDEGRRYGVEVRIVRTADGIQSAPVYGDFVRSA